MKNRAKLCWVGVFLAYGMAIAQATETCHTGALKVGRHNSHVAALARAIEASDPCHTQGEIGMEGLRRIWAVFLQSDRTGGMRFGAVRPRGTPQGTVMAVDGGVQFDFSAVAAEGLRSFVVATSNQRAVLVDKGPLAEVTVPIDKLDPALRYDWSLSTRSQTYQGQFSLINAEDARIVADRIHRLDRTPLPRDVRELYLAAIYDNEGLYSQRDHVLSRLAERIGVDRAP